MRITYTVMALLSFFLPISVLAAAGQEGPVFITDPNPSFSDIAFKADVTRRVGSFGLTPTAYAGLVSTDNVRFTSANKDGDQIAQLGGAVSLASAWSRHELKATASVDAERYFGNDDENTVDAALNASGRYDFSQYTSLSGDFQISRNHEPRSIRALDLARQGRAEAKEPVEYGQTLSRLSFATSGNRLRFVGAVAYRTVDYSNLLLVDGSYLDQNYRQSNLTTGDARLDYKFGAGTAVFLNYQANSVRFDFAQSGKKRDSDGYSIRLGAAFDLTDLLTGDVQVGHMRQEYKDASYKPVSGASYQANLRYLPTRLTTLTFTARRSIEDSPSTEASGYFYTLGRITVRHELTRRLNLGASYEQTQYDYNGIERDDKYNGIYVGAQYELNRRMMVEVNYRNRKFESHGNDAFSDPKYTENRVGAWLKTTF
ncbi:MULTISPECIES: outer membrane beta-barrel protein [Asticcacaulis]|uniref:outer membrane beta-barrel protein n=1 Tax=Asticcacaulis TaxID=76890 RepID=UPI001AE20409|nr:MULTISPECIES: outer membrane beta-barrel protein [Asticcacaulis]MBP2159802.1 hypothetical protein [Asticcacaulis solisilvae]MDR6800847.1 hypothetical protein [Asticcacaulis sp. BE141]